MWGLGFASRWLSTLFSCANQEDSAIPLDLLWTFHFLFSGPVQILKNKKKVKSHSEVWWTRFQMNIPLRSCSSHLPRSIIVHKVLHLSIPKWITKGLLAWFYIWSKQATQQLRCLFNDTQGNNRASTDVYTLDQASQDISAYFLAIIMIK